jgi:hypothetical protein
MQALFETLTGSMATLLMELHSNITEIPFTINQGEGVDTPTSSCKKNYYISKILKIPHSFNILNIPKFLYNFGNIPKNQKILKTSKILRIIKNFNYGVRPGWPN